MYNEENSKKHCYFLVFLVKYNKQKEKGGN